MTRLYSIGNCAKELQITVSALRHLASKTTGLSDYQIITPSIKMRGFSDDDLDKMKKNLGQSAGGKKND
jgi:hypothetical protein